MTYLTPLAPSYNFYWSIFHLIWCTAHLKPVVNDRKDDSVRSKKVTCSLKLVFSWDRWEEARDGILALPDDAFETAGGNGHSRTSMLWFVANRPPRPVDQMDPQSEEENQAGDLGRLGGRVP